MYDNIFARSFSKNEQKRFGNCAFVICIFVALALCTIFRPSFHLSILNVELSTSRGVDMVILGASQVKSQIGRKDGKLILEPLSASSHTSHRESNSSGSGHSEKLSLNIPSYINHTKISRFSKSGHLQQPTSVPTSASRNDASKDSGEVHYSVDCNFLETLSDYCKLGGPIRIHGYSSTIFTSSLAGNNSWSIKPYSRKGSDAMKSVRKWTIKPVVNEDMPSCTTTHDDPAILFSTGGFSGNHFHDFSDIIIPLVTNSQAFNQKVHLLVTNYKGWWVSKFQRLLNQLSNHQVVDIDSENQVHCYQNAIVGLRSHKELAIDSSRSVNGYCMKAFRDFLRSTYSLERQEVLKLRPDDNRMPRLMIISRKNSRRITNEGNVVKMARKLGYEVVLVNITLTTNLSSFARIVNSCDVFMGVHGAGLTNMVFLPDHAVVVQVVPLGGIEGFAKTDFGEPSKEMNLRYLKYSIRVKESSLATKYAADDVVLRDPMVIHKQGWDALRNTYLVQQNVKLDVRRFRFTLLKALKLLQQQPPPTI